MNEQLFQRAISPGPNLPDPADPAPKTSEPADYPSAMLRLDSVANDERTSYIYGKAGHIIIGLVGAAIFQSLAGLITSVDWKHSLLVVAAIFLVVRVSGGFYLRSAGLEKHWFLARAAAEELRHLTWRYVAGLGMTSGFQPIPAAGDVNRDFTSTARTIVSRAANPERRRVDKTVKNILADESSACLRPTPWMQKTRALPLDQRIIAYGKGRLKDQIGFYEKRVAKFAKHASTLKFSILSLECLALLCCAVMIFEPDIFLPSRHPATNQLYVFVSVFATRSLAPLLVLIAALQGWSEVRHYAEIHRSYEATLKNLKKAEVEFERLQHSSNPAETHFLELVCRTERTLMSEVRSWYARRGVAPFESDECQPQRTVRS